jgi:hypothetical protein
MPAAPSNTRRRSPHPPSVAVRCASLTSRDWRRGWLTRCSLAAPKECAQFSVPGREEEGGGEIESREDDEGRMQGTAAHPEGAPAMALA